MQSLSKNVSCLLSNHDREVYMTMAKPQNLENLDPKPMGYLNERWNSKLFCGKGFFRFLFQFKDNHDLIFHSNPWFLGTCGFYINQWSPYLYPEKQILPYVLIWVRLPHLLNL